MDIVLATTSPYRQRLFERLQLPFRCVAPNVDESPLPAEPPDALAQRLATGKARAVSALHPQAVVIGSDQVASIDGDILGKPGNFAEAARQLRRSAGREVHFFTAVSLLSPERTAEQFHVEPFCVVFRSLSDRQIADYLHREQPYDCAGSFKVEGLGIALFERLEGNDPTSLEGLPLIALTNLLLTAGVQVLEG
jgi:septum formation protein